MSLIGNIMQNLSLAVGAAAFVALMASVAATFESRMSSPT